VNTASAGRLLLQAGRRNVIVGCNAVSGGDVLFCPAADRMMRDGGAQEWTDLGPDAGQLYKSPQTHKDTTIPTSTTIKGKGSPCSITEHRVPELTPALGSQPAGDASHKPGVTPATHKRAATNFVPWQTEAQWVQTVCPRLLPDSVTTAI